MMLEYSTIIWVTKKNVFFHNKKFYYFGDKLPKNVGADRLEELVEKGAAMHEKEFNKITKSNDIDIAGQHHDKNEKLNEQSIIIAGLKKIIDSKTKEVEVLNSKLEKRKIDVLGTKIKKNTVGNKRKPTNIK